MTQLLKPLDWKVKGITPVYAIQVTEQALQKARVRVGYDPLSIACELQYGLHLTSPHGGSLLIGGWRLGVELDGHHKDAAQFLKCWRKGQTVYPTTFLFCEF